MRRGRDIRGKERRDDRRGSSGEEWRVKEIIGGEE